MQQPSGVMYPCPGRTILKTLYRCRQIAVIMVALLSMTSAHSGSITMATSYSLHVTAEGLVLAVTVENRGDVPAHAVQIEIDAEGSSLTGPVWGQLGVEESVAAEFPLKGFSQGSGRYPFVIRTYYRDSAGQRYTALIVGFYERQPFEETDVSIQGMTTVLPPEGKGQLTFFLTNEGAVKRTIDLSLYLPDELSVSREHLVIELTANGSETVVFELGNYSARKGSRYPVILVGRYEHEGGTYGVAGTAIVRVVADTTTEVKSPWVWFILCGLLPVVMVSLRLYERNRRPVME